MIPAGSLLVAHPTFSEPYNEEAVVFITESTPEQTVGLRLNLVEHRPLQEIVRPEYLDTFPVNHVYISGPVNPSALICFHSGEWYSKNTMPITRKWSISSDEVMLDKLSMQNYPDFFKLCLGFTVWTESQVEYQTKSKNPSWLVLNNPSDTLIMTNANKMWTKAITEASQEAVEAFF